jgi:hypothetical protein
MADLAFAGPDMSPHNKTGSQRWIGWVSLPLRKERAAGLLASIDRIRSVAKRADMSWSIGPGLVRTGLGADERIGH